MSHTYPDFTWLALTGLMTALMWMPHILRYIAQVGMMTAFLDREAVTDPAPAWAKRSKRAHINAQLNFGIFAGLLIAAHMAGVNVKSLGTLAMVYFFARLAHYIVYTFGLPFLRPMFFMVGSFVQAIIAYQILITV